MLFSEAIIDLSGHVPGGTALSTLMTTAISGKNGVPVSELVGQSGVDRLIARFEDIFGMMMGQLINSYARTDTPTSSTSPTALPTLQATLFQKDELRLVQSEISTRISQSLLALMAICAIVAYFMIKTRNVLPRRPDSIATLTSLVTRSELIESNIFPPGSEWANEKELLSLLDGWLFSMGWWSNKDGYRFGIDVDEHADSHLRGIDGLKPCAEQHSETVTQTEEASENRVGSILAGPNLLYRVDFEPRENVYLPEPRFKYSPNTQNRLPAGQGKNLLTLVQF